MCSTTTAQGELVPNLPCKRYNLTHPTCCLTAQLNLMKLSKLYHDFQKSSLLLPCIVFQRMIIVGGNSWGLGKQRNSNACHLYVQSLQITFFKSLFWAKINKRKRQTDFYSICIKSFNVDICSPKHQSLMSRGPKHMNLMLFQSASSNHKQPTYYIPLFLA